MIFGMHWFYITNLTQAKEYVSLEGMRDVWYTTFQIWCWPFVLMKNIFKTCTFKWYFFCKDWRTWPVWMPHIHHVNNKPSIMRHTVPGSIAGKMEVAAAVAIAREMPPSIQMAWQMHGPVQGVSSFNLSTLRPNNTQGQNSPVKPAKKVEIM